MAFMWVPTTIARGYSKNFCQQIGYVLLLVGLPSLASVREEAEVPSWNPPGHRRGKGSREGLWEQVTGSLRGRKEGRKELVQLVSVWDKFFTLASVQ